MSKLKVLTLNHEFPPVGGGASPIAFELCKHLAQLGHHVDVVTMRYKDLPKFETVDGVNIYRTPALRKKADICHTHELATYLPGAICKVMRLIRQHKYDIIHCHFIVPGSPLAWIASKLSGIPFIVTCHGTDVPGHNPERFGLIHKLINPAWRFLAKRASLLVSPSEFLKDLILKNCPKANTRVIANGIYLDRFGPQQKTKSILMCSRILQFKGFQYAIEAIKDLELDWQVNVIGDGPYLPELKRLAASSKTPITFLGWLDKTDPKFIELFNASSIFIFPSQAENFPTVLLEAMAAGTAIITSKAGGCPEVVGDAGLLVEPKNADAIRENLIKLTGSEQLREELMAASLSRAKQFTWQNISQMYLDSYNEIITTTK